MERLRILLIEENVQDYLFIRQSLEEQAAKLIIDWAPNYENANQLIKKGGYNLYLIGYYPNNKTQRKFLAWLYDSSTNVTTILLTDTEIILNSPFSKQYQVNFLYKKQISWTKLEQIIHYSYHFNLLNQREKQFRLIFEKASKFIGLITTEAILLEINPTALQFIDTEREAVINLPLWDTPWIQLSPQAKEQFTIAINAVLEGEIIHAEIEIYGHENILTPFEFILTPIKNEHKQIVWILIEGHDLTERKQIEKQLMHATLHDQLTGLPNRHLFIEHLERAMVYAQADKNYHIAVLFIDLDRFKIINESLGHDMGDWLLMEIAQRLQDCIDEKDIVARSGGDEFMILLDNLTELNHATHLASTINKELARPFLLDGYEIVTSASIGIAYNIAEEDSTDLLRDADIAMYRAKARGKSCYAVFSSHMHNRAVSRLQIESDLNQALEKRNFVLFYQPQTELSTEKLVGTESLIRFNHAKMGLMSPADFIPILEDTGSIVVIGEWILKTACNQFKHWSNKGLSLNHISVNLSPHQFRSKHLTHIIEESIKDSGIQPYQLEIELTEGTLLEDVNTAIKVLTRFKDMGVRIAIDDFGTGYASLSYLKRFPADCLKIDRSFIMGVTSTPEDAAITIATINMAHALGLIVVAEGVETIEQRNFLREHGCDMAQGYLYAAPMNDRVFLDWALQYNRVVTNIH